MQIFAIGLLTCLGSLTAFTQTTTDSTGAVVTVAGKKYVLVSERTFGRIEKIADELPAIRLENMELKAEKANAQKIIASDAEIIAMKDKVELALQNALRSAENANTSLIKAIDSERLARVSIEKALTISETERARLQKKVSRYRLIAVGAVTIGIAARLLGL